MRTPVLCPAIALVLAAACANDAPTPMETAAVTVPVFEAAAAVDAANFRAHAHGGEEVPAVETRAQGQAVFRLTEDGAGLRYQLFVANIMDVTQAHIHRAPAGSNGGVVAWLYPSGPPATLIPGRSQGMLAEGVITSANLVGSLAGMDLEDLLAEMRSGNAYVNVHTSANPPGEIRGQIR